AQRRAAADLRALGGRGPLLPDRSRARVPLPLAAEPADCSRCGRGRAQHARGRAARARRRRRGAADRGPERRDGGDPRAGLSPRRTHRSDAHLPAAGRRMTTRLFVVVLCAAAVAFAMPYRQPNCNTGAHLALVQSLAHGNRTIDAVYGESCDTSWWHGHFYANKAPGLALVTVPWYELLRAAHVLRPDAAASAGYPEAMRAIPRRDLWLLGLWGAVLPALALLVLVRRVAEGVEPGAGTAAAALLG